MLSWVLIDSGASCNLIDPATWELLKKMESSLSQGNQAKSCLLMGRTILLKRLEHSEKKLDGEVSGKYCEDEFSVVEGPGRLLLGKDTVEKSSALRADPMENEVCLLTTEDDDAHFLDKYADIFTGVGKLRDFRLKLHVKENVTPIAQLVRSLPFGLRSKVAEKLEG
ncbi:uncharacterized protein [Montipora capricornis]|uniref:uncharacterized protein n=1 Tax=Montipora capricornis TaxID=246305 RepID=UPI0035F12EBA